MARIRTYALDDNVTGSDYWIGTDGNNNSNTKNFSPNSVAKYLNENEVVDVSNSIRFRYDTIDSGKPRKEGTLSFQNEIGATVPMQNLSSFILSKKTQSGKDVSFFLNVLPNKKVILQKSDNINLFGLYKILSIVPRVLEPDFFNVSLQFMSGYGSIEEDKDYIISLIDTSEEQNLQSVTDIGATTTNPITITVGDGGANGITSYSSQGIGVRGESNETFGVYGTSTSAAGVYGIGTIGVFGESAGGNGVEGVSVDGNAIYGNSSNVIGVYARSDYGTGLYGYTEDGVAISVQSNSIGLEVNGNGTIAIEANLGNSNKGLVINSGASSTGNFIELDKNGVDKLTVNQAGELTAEKLIKKGGVGNNVLLDNGDTIALTSIESATTTPITADLEVGGIANQQVVPIGTNLQEFATLLLKKTYYPTLTAPTFSLSNNAGTREIGSSNAFNLTFNFNRGNILGATVGGVWIPSSSQGSRAGTATSYTIDGITQSGNVLSVSPTLLSDGNTFNGTVSYATGIQPVDSVGVDYNEEYPAGTSPSRSTTVQGIYPYFWYKSSSPITAVSMQTAIANGQANYVLEPSTGTITIDFNAAGEYLAFAYPETSTTKTIWFVTTLNSGTIPGGVFGSSTTLPCNSPSIPTPLWSNVSYKIHTTAGLITELDPMQLRNS